MHAITCVSCCGYLVCLCATISRSRQITERKKSVEAKRRKTKLLFYIIQLLNILMYTYSSLSDRNVYLLYMKFLFGRRPMRDRKTIKSLRFQRSSERRFILIFSDCCFLFFIFFLRFSEILLFFFFFVCDFPHLLQ